MPRQLRCFVTDRHASRGHRLKPRIMTMITINEYNNNNDNNGNNTNNNNMIYMPACMYTPTRIICLRRHHYSHQQDSNPSSSASSPLADPLPVSWGAVKLSTASYMHPRSFSGSPDSLFKPYTLNDTGIYNMV